MKRNRIRSALRAIGDIFLPLLPGIICAGLCAGFASLISQAVPDYGDNKIWAFVYQILSLIHSAMMTFLTAWAGYRAAERFGGTPILGGMLSNMIANLKDMNAMDKFDEALLEIPAVRKDLGYPPLVTPLSQLVGNQAVTNVLVGERYKNISNEVKNYFKGEYGIAPAPVNAELEAKILGEGGKPVDCRIEDSKRTGEDFKKAKEALGDLAETEEDLMSWICFPAQAEKFLKDRKANREKVVKYTIEEA